MKQTEKPSVFAALYLMVSGLIAGMLAAAILPQVIHIRLHPTTLLVVLMIAGSFLGFLMSCRKT